MTIRLKLDEVTGLPILSGHTATLYCDVCSATMANVDLNTAAHYVTDTVTHAQLGISLQDSAIGGTCGTTTNWPIANGTPDAIAIVAAKTA